jgi:dihydroorotate dehydrogenase
MYLAYDSVVGLASDLRSRVGNSEEQAELGAALEAAPRAGGGSIRYEDAWPVIRFAYKYGAFDLMPKHGIPPVPYDLRKDITDVRQLEALRPRMFEEPPALPLKMRPTEIAGCRVDFPLGLPASILAAHSAWIEFFAKRGFSILTYKTVRSTVWPAHPLPNWVFLDDAQVSTDGQSTVTGYVDDWPNDLRKVSMANSFGVPSFEPEWWQRDLERTRAFVREGHQALIVSVVATVNDSFDRLRDDFVKVAVQAAKAGADIIELNCSCPNTPGEDAGLIYTKPKVAAAIAAAVQEALRPTKTPLLLKIGYLSPAALADFVLSTAPYVDGVVGINTMTARVFDHHGRKVFPDRKDPDDRVPAGVSGWAIQPYAAEVAAGLVRLRREVWLDSGKVLTMLSVGGVLNKTDFERRLSSGVDGVETCTGAFLNPHIGLDIRYDQDAADVTMGEEVPSVQTGAQSRAQRTGALASPMQGEFPMSGAKQFEMQTIDFTGTVTRRDRDGFGIVTFDDWPNSRTAYGFFTDEVLSANRRATRSATKGHRVHGKAVPHGDSHRIVELAAD